VIFLRKNHAQCNQEQQCSPCDPDNTLIDSQNFQDLISKEIEADQDTKGNQHFSDNNPALFFDRIAAENADKKGNISQGIENKK